MKNQNVQKINTIGKVGRILLSIAIVFLIIGFVCCIILGIGSLAMAPRASEMVKISGNGAATVEISNLPFGISPFKVIKVDEFDFDMFGISMSMNSTEIPDGTMLIDAAFGLDELRAKTGSFFIAFGIMCFIAALVVAAFTISLFFAKRLAKTLEKCGSPFESDVIQSMKRFAVSLIPWAVITCLTGISVVISVTFVLVVMLFVYIFKYGAQLQQEADDTV